MAKAFGSFPSMKLSSDKSLTKKTKLDSDNEFSSPKSYETKPYRFKKLFKKF